MSIYVPAPASSRTGPLLYLAGGFTFGETSVPYFAVSMTVRDLISQVKLPNEVPFSMEQPVEISELFQRERNDDRSRGAIARYLKKPRDLKFFNSITVAILPLEVDPGSGKAQVAKKYSDEEYFMDKPADFQAEAVGVGQVTIYRFQQDKSQGLISWDNEHSLPVVLDGQHRLASLRHLLGATQSTFQGRHELELSRLSVLLLVLDERAGFRDPQARSVMSACRTVFTDLNKHAEPVSRAREYLLDEGDVYASSLRAVLADAVSIEPKGTVTDRALNERKLPLAMVDWRGEKAKFDNGIYITTILSLYPLVESIIGIRKPDVDDYEELPGYVSRLTSRLLDGSNAVEMSNSILARIEKCRPNQIPFSLERDEVRELAEGFRARFGLRIVRVLTEFGPYKDLIDEYSSAGLYNSHLEAWFSLDEPGRKAMLEQLDLNDPTNSANKIATRIKGSASDSSQNLAFQVVFQRALVSAADLFASFSSEISEEIGIIFSSENDALDHFLQLVNTRIAPAMRVTGARSPFVGAGVRADGTIDFRKTRTGAITGFILYAILAPEEIFNQENNRNRRMDISHDWVASKWENISKGPKSGISKVFSSQGVAWKRGLLDVVKAREIEDEAAGALELAASQLMALADV